MASVGALDKDQDNEAVSARVVGAHVSIPIQQSGCTAGLRCSLTADKMRLESGHRPA